MTSVKGKTTMNRTRLPDQKMANTKKTPTKAPNAIIELTIIGKIKAQVRKDTNKKSKSNRTTAQSLGMKSRRGCELPWLELPEPAALLHQDELTLEVYTYHYNYFAPLQHLKKTIKMTWGAVHAVHAEHFPDRLVPKNEKVLSSYASDYYHILWVIVEDEKESVAVAEAI
ncbi:hypothetical protein EAE96_007130 [Botrytis aclada]|nr:hypothetical protein EAE96_007130 [Botrytis aclada]